MFEDILKDTIMRRIDGKPAFDFLPEIRKDSKEDLEILQSWKRYFDSQDVPYTIEDCGDHYKLWKEQYVDVGD